MDTSTLTTKDLLAILDFAKRLAEQRTLQPLLDYVVSAIFDLIPAERGLIALFDGEHPPKIAVARDRQGQHLDDAEDQISLLILEQTRRTMLPRLFNDALADDSEHATRHVISLGTRSVMCVPLMSYGRALGAIYLENRAARGRFSEANIVPLVLCAGQVASALEAVRTYESLEERVAKGVLALQEANSLLAQQAAELTKLSLRDDLTGLYNRRHFREAVSQQFEVSRRYKRPLAVAYLDIDTFKQITDTFSRECGDHVLVRVAQIIQESMRAADLVARIGEEEFAIMMPETPLPNAHFACERLRKQIEMYDWRTIHVKLWVTVSIGVAVDQECADLKGLLRAADSRLNSAKRNGQNQVISDDTMPRFTARYSNPEIIS